ncbi:type IV pilin protein [Candidatus Avelusimicrobium caledoniensis]|uniref:type IV pilin protein n=1 Tax=Candidatus Avelusimicrobium caledoniensis TaxID=3416220 RepID=UPI003D113172
MEKKNKKSLSSREAVTRDLRIFVSAGTVNEREKIRRSRITNFRDDRPLCYNNKAFTLIELLVVVLIIGILAAIAVPQYQKAVDKSRATKCLVGLRALRNAQESFYLTNGRIPTDFTELDIDFPGQLSNDHTQMVVDDVWFTLSEYVLCGVSGGLGGALHLLAYYPPNTADALYRGSYFCRSTSDRAEKICQALGGKKLGSRGSYQVYSLD